MADIKVLCEEILMEENGNITIFHDGTGWECGFIGGLMSMLSDLYGTYYIGKATAPNSLYFVKEGNREIDKVAG